jgi:2-polyprenyl-6-methoxyphenol hydroxylase-like FAD-dependent oxidoreductase
MSRCDGGRSLVRKAAGIGFPRWDATTSSLIADVELTELPVLWLVAAPSAVLISPDGYVAWVGEGTLLGLVDVLSTWFASPVAARPDSQ